MSFGRRDSRRSVVTGVLACLGLVVCVELLVACSGAASSTSPAAAPTSNGCPRVAGVFAVGKAVDPPITLSPDAPAVTVNFGSDRAMRRVGVVLRASRPVPPDVDPGQLDLEVVRGLVRQGDTMTSVVSKPLRFSEPRLNPRRDMITFEICVDGAGLPAGHYTSAVSAEGPSGVGPSTITLAANAKDGFMFATTMVAVGVAVFVLLVWRGVRSVQTDHAKVVARAVTEQQPDADGKVPMSTQMLQRAQKAVSAPTPGLGKDVIRDPLFWTGIVSSMVLALGAAYGLYSRDTGWGEEPGRDVVALATTILSAAGLRSLIATTAGK